MVYRFPHTAPAEPAGSPILDERGREPDHRPPSGSAGVVHGVRSVGAFVGRSWEHEARLRDELARLEPVAPARPAARRSSSGAGGGAKDFYTAGHLRRVSEYADAVG